MIDATFQLTTGRVVLVAFALHLVFGILMFQVGPYPELAAVVSPLPEEMTGPSTEATDDALEMLGPGGRASYVRFQALDTINATLFWGFATLLIAWLLKRGGQRGGMWRALTLVPSVTLVAELAENALLANAARVHGPVSSLQPGATILKFAALGATALSVLVALGCVITHAIASRRVKP